MPNWRGPEHAVKLGVFLANTKTRRARLTTDQLQQLAAVGPEWAKTTQTQTETETVETKAA